MKTQEHKIQEQKEAGKRFTKIVYTGLSLALSFFSAGALWYYNVGVGWDAGYFGYRTLLAVGVLFSVMYYVFARMYHALKIGLYRLWELTFSQMLSYGIADVFLYTAAFFWFHDFSRIRVELFFVGFLIQFFLITGISFVLNRIYAALDEPRRMLIIYGTPDYKLLVEKMAEMPYRYKLVDCLPETTKLGKIYHVLDSCKDVYLYNVKDDLKNKLIVFCDMHGKDIHLSMGLTDLLTLNHEISHTFDTPYLRNRKSPVRWYYPAVKRLFDILLSLCGLIVLSPVFFVTALCIHFTDGGPVFYRQKRMTTGGRQFDILKFRSMRVDAEAGQGARLSSEHDDRITPVGNIIRKCRIDELPQLFNILTGDMSIVGPRPERPEIAALYEEELPEFRLRLKVKAGLTGYAQVYGRYNTTPQDKLKLDLIYIAERSILFDIRLIFYTLKIIFIPESTQGIADDQTTALKK